MSNTKTNNAVPESYPLFRQDLKSPCRKECGIKQRQDGENRWGEKLGCSCGNQQESKLKLVFQWGSRFMHVCIVGRTAAQH